MTARTEAEKRAARQARCARYYQKHKDRVLAANRKWAEENPERARELIKRGQAKKRQRYAESAAVRGANRRTCAEWLRTHRVEHRVRVAKRKALRRGAGGLGISSADAATVLFSCLGLCAYCTRQLPLEIDHIEALSRGGAHDVENAAPACKTCNSSKGNKGLLVWLALKAAA